MFASQPTALQNTWSTTGCRSFYIPPTSHERADSEGSGDQWYTGGLPTPPTAKAMNGAPLTTSSQGLQATYAPSSRHGHNASHSLSGMQHSLSQSSYDTQSSYSRGGIANGYTNQPSKNAIASHLLIPESVSKSKGSLPEFAAEVSHPRVCSKLILISPDHLPILVRIFRNPRAC